MLQTPDNTITDNSSAGQDTGTGETAHDTRLTTGASYEENDSGTLTSEMTGLPAASSLTHTVSYHVVATGNGGNNASTSTNASKDSALTAVAASTADKGLPSDPALDDGDFWEGWHVNGANGVNAKSVWNDYTGEGVRIATLDEGVNHAHSELSNNYNTSIDKDVLDDDANAHNDGGTNETHGSHVSMMIGADDNGSQGVGVAFDSEITGIRRGFGSESSIQDTLDGFEHAETIDAGVMNNSWGTTAAFGDHKDVNFSGTDYGAVHTQMQDMVDSGRGGLGQNIVFSAGNDGNDGMSANYKNFQNSPHTITVGAIDENGDIAGFSEWGANVLLSAPGDTVRVPYAEDGGQAIDISGTSFSAPAVSGVIGLMLEANSDLGYRDVQEILALSARNSDPNDASWQANGAGHWNGGGLTFSHDYGYGTVDAEAAVRLAESWQDQQTYDNATRTARFDGGSADLPDTSTVTSSIDVGTNIAIEHIMIDLDISHDKAGDLKISLTSPDDTTSVLADRIEGGSYTSIYGKQGIDFEFSSLAHMGETSAGEWTLKIEDLASNNSGTLNDWDLRFIGNPVSEDDTYFFTNAFNNLGGRGGRDSINDTDGGTDTINAKAVKYDTTLDLDAGTGTIAGRSVTISGIENATTGKGADTLTGNAADNVLKGGRGNDIFTASAGDDTLNGQQGTDQAIYDFSISEFTFSSVSNTAMDIIHNAGSLGTDLVKNIEDFLFNGNSYSFSDLEARTGTNISIDQSYEKQEVAYLKNGDDLVVQNASGTALNTITDFYASDFDTSMTFNASGRTVDLRATNLRVADTTDGASVTGNADNEMLLGGTGTDTLSGKGGVDEIFGAAGADMVHAGAGDDKVYGGDGHDTLNGDAGDDLMTGNAGDDALHGNDGRDRLSGQAGSDNLHGGAGKDILKGGADNDTLYGDSGNDRLFGQDGDDTLYGGAGDDYLNGGNGNDTVSYTNAGDNVQIRLDASLVKTGIGNESLVSIENAKGSGFDDYIVGDSGANTLGGLAGNDKIKGGAGDDTLNGGTGDDRLIGGEGGDTLNGMDGNDKLKGNNGNDTLNGNGGNDLMTGNSGDDSLYGGDGRDKLYGQAGQDDLHGGADTDILKGGANNDTLNGNGGHDTLYGQGGDDTLYGDAGNDKLVGGDGDDTLIAGGGVDNMYGGSGSDVFEFNNDTSFQDYNAIRDFDRGEGDVLDIADILTGYDPVADAIEDFVSISGNGYGSSTVAVDSDGGGNNYRDIAVLDGVTGISDISGTVNNGEDVV